MSDAFSKDEWIALAYRCRAILVSEDGTIRRRVWRADGAHYQVVKVSTHKKTGRVYFNLTFQGVTKSVLVNRVVAIALLPNPLNLPEVNHIDGDLANNAKSNLEWASRKDNEDHAQKNGLKTGRGSSNSNAKLTASDVIAIRNSCETDAQLAITYSVARKTIRDVRERKTWSHV